MSAIETDILLIGAGPVGLYGAYYAGFRGLRTTIMDILPEPGGQIMAMYPEKDILDIAGFPSVLGRELIANLIEQAAPFGPRYLLGHQARCLDYDSGGLPVVLTSGDAAVHAKAVIITGGIGTFTPRRLAVADGYEGRGLSYFVVSPSDHAGRDVVIVGGGDSAFDWALALEPLARSVTLVHRRSTFRAHDGTVRRVLASRVEVIVDASVVSVDGSGSIAAVQVRDPAGVRTLPAQTVVAALGFVANPGPLLTWGIDMASRHVRVDSRMATNRPRVFAAGDITEYPGKVRLIAVGFGEVATAVNNAATVIDPSLELFPGHSTAHLSTAHFYGSLRRPHDLRHRRALHRQHRPLLHRGVPGGLHLRGRAQALHPSGRVHRLRRLRGGVPGERDHRRPAGRSRLQARQPDVLRGNT